MVQLSEDLLQDIFALYYDLPDVNHSDLALLSQCCRESRSSIGLLCSEPLNPSRVFLSSRFALPVS